MEDKKLSRKNYKYIYDYKWANYLMTHGVTCRGTGFNRNTNSFYWAFDYEECQPVYNEYYANKNT